MAWLKNNRKTNSFLWFLQLFLSIQLLITVSEKTIIIESLDVADFYGVHNQHLKLIRKHFPKLQLIARGNELKVIGTD
ncbi:MAG: hypothetical protein H3C71_02805, partial [Flavobacteriales bacterium]|nr:hypothetical protein [Flavobacteriales bacterium]